MTPWSIILAWLLVVGTYQTVKPLPENININSADYQLSADELDFLGDITYTLSDSQRVSEQEIFDTILDIIDTAEHYILLDMFLYNSDKGKDFIAYRPVSDKLTDKLIAKRKSNPSIKIDLITDPVNTLYGGSPSEQFSALENAGINVIITNHSKLRDSNPIYSSIWRTFFQWFGNSERFGLFPHPFGKDDRVTLRSYLRMLNMKANHRKLIIADSDGEMVTVVASANPHDASSAHSNVAVMVKGDIWQEIYLTEKAVAKISKKELQEVPEHLIKKSPQADSDISVRVLSEGSIRDELYNILENSGQGD
ncbi:phospholipase, partial [Candidatus Latescibacterota bacterium]